MKKALFITATALALALVGCQPQQGTSPSDSGVESGRGQGALTNQPPPTNNTNQGSSQQQSQPSQTQPNQQ